MQDLVTSSPGPIPNRAQAAWHVAGALLLATAMTWAVASHVLLPERPWSVGALLTLAVASLALGHVLHRRWLPATRRRFAAWSPRQRVLWLLGCVVVSLLLGRAIPLHAPRGVLMVGTAPMATIPDTATDANLHRPNPSQEVVTPTPPRTVGPGTRLMRLAFHVTHLVALTALLLIVGLWLHARETSAVATRPSAREGVAYALPSLAAGLLWVMTTFPGMMSSDSLDQWNQAFTGRFFDTHPVFHTFIIRLLTHLWDSPAVVTLPQVLGFAALVGWGCVSLRQAGLSRAVAWSASVLVAIVPVNGALAATVWKDVPFSLAIMALCILLFRATAFPGTTARPRFWVAFGLCSVLVLLLRHNGPPAVLGAFLAVAALDRRRLKTAALVMVLVLVAATGTRRLLFLVYGAVPLSSGLALMGYLGAHVAAGTPMDETERAVLEDLHPLDDRWNYDCFSNVPTVFDGRFDMEAVARHRDVLPRLTLALTLRNPRPTLNHLVCATSMLWKVWRGDDPLNATALQNLGEGRWNPINAQGLNLPHIPRHTPLMPEAWSQRLMYALQWTTWRDAGWLFWGPALPLYLSLLACAVACLRRRSWRPAAVLVPLLLHTLVLALVIPSQDVRYQFPLFLVGYLFIPAWLFGPRALAAREAPGKDRLTDQSAASETAAA
ncbi:glycosyltransferase family 39 protein [Pyxidicoccus parkwayensis]|uniref:Glycosyltransferase family 39 protein n=1 Tax=Pyxidicoccus parkwayensis TaxID=2813578 RepID=A0ABX7P3R8_9BACT|nr:glycosyltransferase family 39 protein [Pyxidicoccus parkwaysis]QSQ25080.1 glycosyltransferase family 39 protein [Pyxidicoccus parkwaysis]